MAKKLLGNEMFTAYMLDKYNVLTTLYSSSTTTLRSLLRGMVEMLGVSDAEWDERAEQLDGHVDAACTLEARLELFLLGVGRGELEMWILTVKAAMGMEERERRAWGQVYGDAAAFLVLAAWDVDQ